MPSVLAEAPRQLSNQDPPRKRWTREECAALEAAGLLDQERLELIDGDLIDKMGKKRRHVEVAGRLHIWLSQVFGVDSVNFEAPIDVAPEDNPASEPQPDMIVLNRQALKMRSTPPQPHDLDLVIEISDTTLTFDLTTKASLYARAGIVEYWVLDATTLTMIVHREPRAGRYQSILAYSDSENVAPLAAPDAMLKLGDLVPRR